MITIQETTTDLLNHPHIDQVPATVITHETQLIMIHNMMQEHTHTHRQLCLLFVVPLDLNQDRNSVPGLFPEVDLPSSGRIQ